MTRRERGWPTLEQEWLLRAALLPGAEGRLALERWLATVDFERLDLGSKRLLPLLFRNLDAMGPGPPQLPTLRSAYESTRAGNEALFRRMSEVLRALREAGVEALVLKGPALAVLHYRDLGQRPMRDADVLVRASDFEAAQRAVERLGFVACSRMLHALTLRDAEGHELDLHRRLLHATLLPRPGDDEDFWRAAVPLEIGGAPTRALGPADQLLHLLEHGLRHSPRIAPLRWVPDAAMVLATSSVDWERLVLMTQARQLALPVGDGLGYLQRLLGERAALPPGLLARVRDQRVAYWIALDYSAGLKSAAERGPLESLWAYASQYAEEARLAGGRPTIPGFLDFLRRIFGLVSFWRLPAYVVSGFLHRSWRSAARRRSIDSPAGSAAPTTGTPP